jgi:hypothetical protein
VCSTFCWQSLPAFSKFSSTGTNSNRRDQDSRKLLKAPQVSHAAGSGMIKVTLGKQEDLASMKEVKFVSGGRKHPKLTFALSKSTSQV